MLNSYNCNYLQRRKKMKRSIFALLFIFISLLVITPKLWAQPPCVEANGLLWCFNNQECGQACNEVCAEFGGVPIDDDTVWFEAQDTPEECEAISQAFGLGNNFNFTGAAFSCLQDTFGDHTVGGGLNLPLRCTSASSCPSDHRTEMDQPGVPCGPESRRSICPCDLTKNIPTLSEWGVIAIAGALGIIGIWAVRRRKLIA